LHRSSSSVLTGEAFIVLLAATTAVAVAVAAIALIALRRERLRPSSAPTPLKASPGYGTRDVLLDHIPYPIVLVDHRARIVETNRAARELLPALRDGQPLSFALRSPDVLEALDKVVRVGGTLKADFALRTPMERRFEVQVTALDVDPESVGARSSILLFFRDLTPAWRIERMRADFVANASHELRTPLASILGFIETLQGPARNDAAARERFLDIMRDQAKRMTRLINDLLSLSRIEMRAHLPVTTDVDFSAVIAQVIDELTPLAQERSVDIALAAPEEPVWVLGDQDELQRMVENVIENAIKYGESGQKVEVQLKRLDASVSRKLAIELSVRDYGPGIAPEHLPRLTERFYRVDATASRQRGGTGLGLALVKHIVNRHRGRLAIESELGRGTTVRVALPEHVKIGGADRSA
jgi:two-component system, OmpR family, phosphate regulon sensor histidine kinase PhoR